MKRNLLFVIALLVLVSLVAAQCGGAPATEAPPEPAAAEEEMAEEPAEEEMAEEPTEEPAEEAAMPAEVDFAVVPGGALEAALAGEYAGGTVTVDGPFTDPDDVLFAQSMEAFEE